MLPSLHKDQKIARPDRTARNAAVLLLHGQRFVVNHTLDLRRDPVGHLYVVMILADLVHGGEPVIIGVDLCLFGADDRPQIDPSRHVRVERDVLRHIPKPGGPVAHKRLVHDPQDRGRGSERMRQRAGL